MEDTLSSSSSRETSSSSSSEEVEDDGSSVPSLSGVGGASFTDVSSSEDVSSSVALSESSVVASSVGDDVRGAFSRVGASVGDSESSGASVTCGSLVTTNAVGESVGASVGASVSCSSEVDDVAVSVGADVRS